MRKLTFYLILLFLAAFMSSCEIKAPSADDDEDNFLHSPTPSDNEIGVSLQPMLNWIYDANSSNISFTIYLGTLITQIDSIAFVNSNSYYIPSPLEGNKTYYWKVKTTFEGETYESNVWRFTTTASGGMILNNPNPPDGASDVSLTPQLSWQYNGTNPIFEYDIFMDTNYQANIYIGQTPTPNYLISTPLQSGKTYYWKIRAYYNSGFYESSIWRFKTIAGLPTNGLVAYYPFSGNTIDSSGNLNHGQNNGATLTMDRFNYSNRAYWFNGSNSYINVTHSSSLQPTTGITLSAWVKLNTLDRAASILAKGYANEVGMYSLKYDSLSRKLYFEINFSDNNSGIVSSYTTLQTYQWYNVIGTFDGNKMGLYINGSFENSLLIPKTLGSNYSDLKIGRCAEGFFLNGDLDDIRIYNRVLTDIERLQLYHEGGWSKK